MFVILNPLFKILGGIAKFITETKFSDDYRGESFSKTFPEYYELFLESEEFDDEL